MSRPKLPLESLPDDHLVRQIYREFKEYAQSTGFYPTQNALYSLMVRPQWNAATRVWDPARYTVPRGQFEYWFRRLVEEGYIAIDQGRTRAVNATALSIVERDGEVKKLE